MNDTFAVQAHARSAVPRSSNALFTARAILADTLEYYASRRSVEAAKVTAKQMRSGDRALQADLERRLARSLAEYLGGMDRDLKAVYLYEQKLAEDDESLDALVTDPLHLVVWAEPKTVALDALITMLNRALTQAMSELRKKSATRRALDAHLIDDAEVRDRVGYAAFLFSPHHRPVQVWRRADVASDASRWLVQEQSLERTGI